MRKSARHFFTVVMAVFCCLSLCGCSLFSVDTADLLVAPKLTGEMQPICAALEQAVSEKHALKYPSEGQYRSAITMIDLDADGGNEAVAFYSTTSEKSVTMHLAVVDETESGWKVTAEQKLVAGGVERVAFADMDGNGSLEIVVGWSVYGTVDKQVSIYQYSGKAVLSVLDEPYSAFTVCDLNGDLINDILILSLNLTAGTASARYYGVSFSGVHEIGTCAMDGSVTYYYDPIVSKAPDGQSYLYVDSVKGAGVQTEVLLFNENGLVNPLYNETTRFSPVTQRSSTVICRDFDGDGETEIPMMTPLPVGEQFSNNEKAFLTSWTSFRNDGFVTKKSTLMNYTDGYYLTVNAEQTTQITVIRNTEERERNAYLYDYTNGTFGEKVFTIRAVSRTVYESGSFDATGFSVLGRNDSLVYLAICYPAAETAGFSVNSLHNSFYLISEGAYNETNITG